MNKVSIPLSVDEAAERTKLSLDAKGFTLFADIDHQANAKSVDLEMSGSRLIVFGNPLAGTKLMQADIAISLDLPLRIAIVEAADETLFIHQTSDYFHAHYGVENHPVLEKIEALFATLISELEE